MIRRIGRSRFSFTEVDAHEPFLAKAYPQNRHVRAKIRQQLQVLRGLGYISFEDGGRSEVRR
jgi:type II restriction enzyme